MTTRPAQRYSSRQAEVMRMVLAGCWRSAPPTLAVTAEQIEAALPLVRAWGAGPVLWHRIRHGPLAEVPALASMSMPYRRAALSLAVRETHLQEVIARLEHGAVPALLFKGWLGGRNYALPFLRGQGSDTDMLVRPGTEDAARAALWQPGLPGYNVDIVHPFVWRCGESWERLQAHSQPLPFGNGTVRAVGAEHNLLFLCENLLRHGARYPMVLCDVAAAIETLPEVFDWSIPLDRPARQRAWVTVGIGLAHTLLGARVDRVPLDEAALQPPSWIRHAVVRQWAHTDYAHKQDTPLIAGVRRRPRELAVALSLRWPGPIEVTELLQAPYLPFKPVPLQGAHFAWTLARFLYRTPKGLLRLR